MLFRFFQYLLETYRFLITGGFSRDDFRDTAPTPIDKFPPVDLTGHTDSLLLVDLPRHQVTIDSKDDLLTASELAGLDCFEWGWFPVPEDRHPSAPPLDKSLDKSEVVAPKALRFNNR